MFTGLVEGLGAIGRIERKGPDAVLRIRPPWDAARTVLGESIAVLGACLTVTGLGGDGFDVDVSAESLARTKLGGLRAGDAVNLERAMQLGDRLGGHLVSGHVDCLGRVTLVAPRGGSQHLEIAIPAEHMRLVVEKGSVTVDGVSLTVNQVWDDRFALNIIPHTWRETTLSLLRPGDVVNIETDLIGKYVARLMGRDAAPARADGPATGLSLDALARAGF